MLCGHYVTIWYPEFYIMHHFREAVRENHSNPQNTGTHIDHCVYHQFTPEFYFYEKKNSVYDESIYTSPLGVVSVLSHISTDEATQDVITTLSSFHTNVNRVLRSTVVLFVEPSDRSDHHIEHNKDIILQKLDRLHRDTSELSSSKYRDCSYALHCAVDPDHTRISSHLHGRDKNLPEDSPLCKKMSTSYCLPWPIVFADVEYVLPNNMSDDDKSYRYGIKTLRNDFLSNMQYHPLFNGYTYLWNLKPGTIIKSQVNYNPFTVLRGHRMYYGWAVLEVLNLDDRKKSFFHHISNHNEDLDRNAKLDGIDVYRHHVRPDRFPVFNTGFEIMDLNFQRREYVRRYYQDVESSLKIYHDSWDSDMIRSGMVSSFISTEHLYYFREIHHYQSPAVQNSPNHFVQGVPTPNNDDYYNPYLVFFAVTVYIGFAVVFYQCTYELQQNTGKAFYSALPLLPTMSSASDHYSRNAGYYPRNLEHKHRV